jgi:hypothetical protein
MTPKAYDLKFRAAANCRVVPADVFALRKETEEVIISRRGNLLDEGDLKKIIRAFAEAVGETEEEVGAFLVEEWNKAQSELLRVQKAEASKPPPGPKPAPDRRTTATELLAAWLAGACRQEERTEARTLEGQAPQPPETIQQSIHRLLAETLACIQDKQPGPGKG